MSLLDDLYHRASLYAQTKLEQAIHLGWFYCKSTGEPSFTISQLSGVFETVALPVPHPTRLKEDFKRSPSVLRGQKRGTYRIARPEWERLEKNFGDLFPAVLEPVALTPIERADLSRTPRLSAGDIDAAKRMAELYVIIHCYENSARKVVEEVISAKLGANWWDIAASGPMKQKVADRQSKEQRNKWITPRGASPLHYIDWSDLLNLIRKYEPDFRSLITDYKFVEARFEELERLRNVVAHNGVLPSNDDFDHVVLSFKQWCKQLT